MKNMVPVMIGVAIMAMMLCGCNEEGSGLGSLFGSDSGMTGSGSGSGSGIGSVSPTVATNPEPATVLLLGGGLIAYVFMRRSKRN